VPKELLEIGHKGEYLADVLNRCERDEINQALEHPAAGGHRLLKQAEAWLSTFVPGVEIRVDSALDVDLATIRFKRGGVSSEWERPANTGFGVSYSLPIVVAGLVAKERSVLVVESPEAHLHPSAQSAMGSFLARLAAVGIQIFIETHSDHILNGIRRSVVEDAHPLSRQDVVINHLTLEDGAVKTNEIKINESGNLSLRPRSFFDQAELDVSAIIKSRFPSLK
jgi:predicted ATPase